MSQENTKTDLGRYLDKMITLKVWTDDEDLVAKSTEVLETSGDLTHVKVSGRITSLNPNGEVFLFKPRSQRTVTMLESEHVTDVELAGSATLRPVGQKRLRPLNAQNARRHLADYHGFPLKKLNTMSDELALKAHDEIDHSDLGHNHELAEDGLNSKASATTAETREQILAKIDAA